MTGEAQSPDSESARIAVIVPCWNDGDLLLQAIGSLRSEKGVEVVVVDDGSTDTRTHTVLDGLEASGITVVRQGSNLGVSAARNRGLAETSAPYVFPLDSDDLAIPGAPAAMRKRLELDPDAGVCYGDYIEFGAHELLRAVPTEIDSYRLAYTNEYPISALFRRSVLEEVGGWRPLLADLDSRQDWNLWLSLAETGVAGIHHGTGVLTYARRMHPNRLAQRGRRQHRRLYDALVAQHPAVFAEIPRHRRRSSLSPLRKSLYPIVYGRRSRWSGERKLKEILDRLGLWTLTGTLSDEQKRGLELATSAGLEGSELIAKGLPWRGF
jgi:glycosyltransferase involved in cell wall biosynthesis